MAASKKTRGKKARRTFPVRGVEAIKTLTSPRCQEIMQAFLPGERLTVQQLAARLGLRQESLYYHVRKLVGIGVLVEADRRLKGRRYESIYELAADRFEVEADRSSGSGQEATARLTESMLRAAAREFRSALESAATQGDGARPHGRRLRTRLSESDLREVTTLLDRLETICSRRREPDDGSVFSITCLVVPLDEPARRDRASAGDAGGTRG